MYFCHLELELLANFLSPETTFTFILGDISRLFCVSIVASFLTVCLEDGGRVKVRGQFMVKVSGEVRLREHEEFVGIYCEDLR